MLGPEPRDPRSSREILRRRRASRFLVSVVTLSLVLSGGLAAPASAGKPSGSTTCTLVPQLRDVTITQGVGSYARFVRGKEALARFYLSLPSCASTSSSIAITGGSLTVSGGGLTTTHAPFPAPASPFPLIAPYANAPALDSAGDPRFVIPGSALRPGGTTASFTASFSATLTYVAKTSSRDAGVTGTVTMNRLPGTTTAITRSVERLTNALRVLVVPMGDASKDYASQFSSSAQSALESGMLTLSRIFPVPDGTADLAAGAAATGGVRYTILPTLLDIGGLLGSDGKFCGGGSSFDTIKGELGQFLLSWNAANPSATADRVVGVVDEAISNGSSLGCADGWSAIGTQGSWVRAITSESPGRTGALLAMEIGHSMGLVPTNRDHTFDPYHSPNQEADGGTNRGYDIRSHTFIADDRTVLRGTGAWNNATTLLEPADYAFLLCMLGGSVSTDCSAPNSVGTATGVGAGPRFVISGTTGGTAATTVVTESYFAGNVALTEPPAASDYSLVQLRDGVTRAAYPIAVETVESLHDNTGTSADSSSTVMLFAAVVPFDELANRIELRHGTEVLYARDRGERPVITSTTVVAAGDENYTDSPGSDDTWPMVSPDGQWVAWTLAGDGTSIAVAPIGDAAAAVVLVASGNESQPAWNPDSDELAFIRSGDLVTVALSFTGGAPVFGAETVVYDADPIEPGGAPDAAHPSWSRDGTQIAFDANGAIFVVDALEGFPDPEQLTFTGDASHPSWSWTPDDNRIAYERNVASGPVLLSGDIITLASYVEPSGDGPIAPASHAGTQFTVNSADDVDDTACNATHCSLREAINAANALAGKDSIHFAAGTGPITIQPTSALPTITSPVVIDGTTQPGWTSAPVVELDGQDLVATGLDITAGTSDVIGLVVNRFTTGIRLTSGNGNTVRDSYIGTDAAGSLARPNAGDGVFVSSANNTIGGLSAADRNVISGNGVDGIEINGASATGNLVLGNFIGTDAAGTASVRNGQIGPASGVRLLFAGAGNRVGGSVAGSRNVISGNDNTNGNGVSSIVSPGVEIVGNYIGTDVTGSVALPNQVGVTISSSTSNVIGGYTAAERNVISGNNTLNVFISGSGATGNLVVGNHIGPDKDGMVGLGNSDAGIRSRSPSNFIGDDLAGAGNVISGNAGPGIDFAGDATGDPTGNVIQRNLIGVGSDGVTPVPNTGSGIGMGTGSANNAVGGPGDGNVIAHNGQDGVFVGVGTGNSILSNSIHSNGGLGIDIGPDGVNANDLDDADTGPNDRQNFPVLTSASYDGASVTLDGTLDTSALTPTVFTVEVFRNAFCNPVNGHGEGETLIHSATTTTDAAGDASFSFTFAGAVTDDVLTATATDPSGNTSEFSQCRTVTGAAPPPEPDLSISQVDSPDPVVVGQQLTYTLTITNLGPADATGVTVEDILPAAVTQLSVTPSQGSCLGTGSITCDLGALASDASATVVIDVRPTEAGNVINTASVTGDQADPVSANNSSSETTTVVPGFVVNSAADPGTGGCNAAECTLREAISAANATLGTQTISFDIPDATDLAPHTISLATALPTITEAVVIDGTTEPDWAVGAPVIELDGSALTAFNDHGLHVTAGPTTVLGLVINGFGGVGIKICGEGAGPCGSGVAGGADGNLIENNFIGTDVGGTTAAGNGSGISISGSSGNQVRGNVLAGNDTYGVGLFKGTLTPADTSGNVIEGNFIGTDLSRTAALGNGAAGVSADGVGGATIGGTATGAGNVVAHNGDVGVQVGTGLETLTTGISVLGNAIHDNGSLGIDLGGGGFVAANDYLDPDTGPNGLQNHPDVFVSDDGTTISGTLLTEQSEAHRIELFRSAACDGSSNGEGQAYLGFVDVTTNADGYARFTFDASGDPIPLADVVTATATDADGNTSEFSACAAPTPTGPQIWTVDPAAPSTTQEALVADAAQPAFGSDGRIAFVRDDAIYSIGANGTGVAQLTSPGAGTYDSMPSMGGVPAFARFFNDFDGGGQWDVFLLRGQVQVVTTVTDDGTPADLRLDIYYQCLGSPAYDVAVALTPDDVETGSASWTTNYDPSLACPDGTLTAIASDGFLRSDAEEAGTIESDPQAPVPTIYAPFDGRQFLQYQGISLHGGAKDAEDGEVADLGLAWFLDGSPVGTGGSLNLSPPGVGWSSGAHTVTLRATDSDSTFVETSVGIVILADADNDWLPADVEADATCFGANADSDPTNSFGDADGDGYSNVDDMLTDEGPCDPADAYTVFATFGPDVLYIPSSGDSVTITVTSPRRDLKQVAGSTVRISDLSGAVVSIPATSWTVDKKGVGVARFSRQAVSQMLTTLGLVGQTVTVTITGTSITHSWTLTGTDTFEAKVAN